VRLEHLLSGVTFNVTRKPWLRFESAINDIYSKVFEGEAARSKLRAIGLKLELVEENQPAESDLKLAARVGFRSRCGFTPTLTPKPTPN
jgi:hypothetical protein